MKRIFAVLLVGVCLLTSITAQEQEEIVDLGPDGVRITRATPGTSLAHAAGATSEDTVADFLRRRHGHDQQTAASLTTMALDPSDRRVHLRFQQRVAGLDVYGTYVKATLTTAGEVVSVVENLVPVDNLQPAQIDYRDALVAALRRRYPGQSANLQESRSAENSVAYTRGQRFYQDPTVTRVAVPLRGKRLRVGYLVETWDHQNNLWHTVVSGKGRVLHEELRTASEKYNVFYPNPSGPQFIYDGPGTGYALSPIGWTAGGTTTGNNVDAYLDRNGDNIPDAGGRPLADANGNFLTVANLSQEPTTANNQKAAVTSLFFASNFLHDFLWVFGFNEPNGNFQNDNFGRGGLGNDAVKAEAQDGGGYNNANFATPPDGTAPRMQMYLWNTPSPDRDSDLDTDTIFHEYGHGLTWRMIGGMSGKLAGAVGEGMGDVLSVYLTLDDAIGEYPMNNSNGFRSGRYWNYTRTYKQVYGNSVHLDGEIYAGTMARLLLLWLMSGRDYFVLWWHMIDGMNYTPSSPAYEDMRDGILASMVTHGATLQDRCVVWDAFARSGIGYGADGRVIPNPLPNLATLTITESFARAPECSGVASTLPLIGASLNRLPRGRIAGDIQTALRQRGLDASAKMAMKIIAPPAQRSTRPAVGH